MPRRRHHYLGNPVFEHLHIDDGSEKLETKEPCQQHHESTSEGLSYQVEGEEPSLPGLDGRFLTESRDVGSEEREDLPAGTSGRFGSRGRRSGAGGNEENEPLQQLGKRQRSGGGDGFPSSRPMTSTGPPPRELRVRLTKNLSTRMHCIRRFVDFRICHSVNSQRQFVLIKGEEDVYSFKNHDYLLRVRIKLVTKRDLDDPYVKDYIAEFKFRGRLFKYNEDAESFEELAVVSQCMAICAVSGCQRVGTSNATVNRISPP